MEKISHIIPAVTRQTWVSGETEKPKRIADPELVMPPASTVGAAGNSIRPVTLGSPHGTKLDVTA